MVGRSGVGDIIVAKQTINSKNMSTSTGTIDGSVSGKGEGSCKIDGISKKNNIEKNISSCSTLDIDDKVDILTTAEVLNQLKELKMKLAYSENERDEFKKQLDDINYEKDKISRQLEVISTAHESRITEMHCVIAELSKKLRNKQDNTILEETEGSEISFQEGSICNSEMNLTNPDVECQTEPVEDLFGDLNNSNFGDEFNDNINNDSAVAKTKVDALQEEVFRLKGHIALLESQLANHNDNNESNVNDSLEKINQFNYTEKYDEDCTDGFNASNEKELNCFYSSNDDNEISQEIYKTDVEPAIDNNYLVTSDENNLFVNNSSAVKKTTKYLQNNMNLLDCGCHIKTPNRSMPTPKMAERVKLRRTTEEQNIMGTNILNPKINKNELVEHLVSSMIQSNNLCLNEFIDSSEYHFESERLKCKVDHLKARNSVLYLSLNEVKEHLDHIYLLCGKYESNAVALQCALNYSDRAIEAYDVMLALLESKLAILKENSIPAEESRKAVESVARHLLDKLESEKNLTENSLGPWQNTFCINDSEPLDPWTMEDDNRLRNHVSKLKGHRAAVQNTIVNLESPFSNRYEKARMIMEISVEAKQECKQKDMELAVAMQELLNLREDFIEEKKKNELAEKEKQIAIEKSYLLEETLQQLQIQLTDSEALLNVTSRDRTSYSEADHAALIERQLVEALTRESELRNRIQTLIGTVSLNKKYDEKHFQVQNTELHKINLNLSHSLEQTKKKYQNKIKRLEQKISGMNLELIQLQKFNQQNDNVPETTL